MEKIELRDFIRPLLRSWWLILLSTAIAAGTSYWYMGQQPQRYQSRTSIMIGGTIQNPNPNGYEFYLAQQLMQTYVDLINRESVRQPTMEVLGLNALPPYSARAVPSTQLMEVVVTDVDPVRTQIVAKALIDQLIVVSPAGNQDIGRTEFINQELDDLEASIIETKEEIALRQDELATLFSARQIADTRNQISALQTKLASLQTNFTNLLSTTQEGAVNALSVIEPPLLGEPVRSNIKLNILLAAAVGFVLAAGGAYLLEYLDDSIKNSDDVQKVMDVAALGAVPVFQGDEKGHELVMLTKSQSPPAEAFRVLRTNLQFAAVARELDTLMITSPAPGEGKSTIAANLALAMAQSGRRVILVDADLHRPRQHRVFKLVNNIGLTTALLGDVAHIDRYLQRTLSPTLRVLTTGPLPPNPAELLGSQRMRDMLNAVQSQADMVLIDCPPATAVADTAVLASQADGVLMILHTGKTRREMAKRALAALEQVEANVVGAVLNRMPTRGSGYYYYYHYKYYRQYYRRDDAVENMPAQQPASANPNPLLTGRRLIPPNPAAGENGHAVNGSRESAEDLFPKQT